MDHLEKFCYGCGIFYAYKHLKGRLELSSSLAPLKSEFSVKEAAAVTEGSPDLLRAKCTRIQEKVVKKILYFCAISLVLLFFLLFSLVFTSYASIALV